eukprot:3456268-Prorocentrum_lima.AAC.1
MRCVAISRGDTNRGAPPGEHGDGNPHGHNGCKGGKEQKEDVECVHCGYQQRLLPCSKTVVDA